MPLLGAIGNASEYSFRGTYDNYPFELDFGDIVNAEPGETYYSPFLSIEDINYKVPISIVGDGEYTLTDDTFDLTFDNQQIELDSQVFSFDADKPIYPYTNLPGYVRNKNKVGIKIYGIPPIKISNNLTVQPISSNSVQISLNQPLNIELRNGPYSFNPNNIIEVFYNVSMGSQYYDKKYSTTITIGKKSFEWSVTTKRVPGPLNFSFNAKENVPISTEVYSDPYIVSGLSDSIEYQIKVVSNNGTLSVNDGSFSKTASVKNGDKIVLKDISSLLENTTTEVAVQVQTIGTPVRAFQSNWRIKTGNYTPDSFGFNSLNDAPLNSFVTSNTVTISGLTDGINYSVTSQSASISIDGASYVTGTTTIRNGQTLTLGYQTSRKFRESKTFTVKVANVSKTWNIRTREVLPNKDPNADKLILASPYDNRLGSYSDVSKLVRSYSGFDNTQYSPPNSFVSSNTSYYPVLSNFESKFYTHSLKTPIFSPAGGDGFTRNLSGRVSIADIKPLGRNDFTLEFWVKTTGFDYTSVSDAVAWMYVNSGSTNNPGIGVAITSSIWRTGSGRVLLNYIDSNNIGQYIVETNSSILLNQWNHISIVRRNDVFNIYINGSSNISQYAIVDIQRTSATVNDVSYGIIPKGSFYMQDLRIYNGLVKYTSNFNPDIIVSPILESYDKDGITESNQLCKSSGSEKNYPTRYCGWYTRTGTIESNPYTNNTRQLVIIWNGVIVYDGNGVTSGGISVGEYTYFPGDKVGDSLYGWNNDYNNAFDVYRVRNT